MAVTFLTGNLRDCLIKKNKFITTSNHSITANLHYYGTKTRVEFNGSCLKQNKVKFKYGKK